MKQVAFPIRLRTTVDARESTVTPLVACPRSDGMVDARRCAGCMRMLSLEWRPRVGGEVVCLLSGEPRVKDPRADFAETAARVNIQEIIAPDSTCVTVDVPIADVRELFAQRRTRAIVVVDDANRLVGLISRADLVGRPHATSVTEIMTKHVHALPASAPIAYAISLMSFEDICDIPIVDEDGQVLGLCHALDVMRWVAQRLGYVVPDQRM